MAISGVNMIKVKVLGGQDVDCLAAVGVVELIFTLMRQSVRIMDERSDSSSILLSKILICWHVCMSFCSLMTKTAWSFSSLLTLLLQYMVYLLKDGIVGISRYIMGGIAYFIKQRQQRIKRLNRSETIVRNMMIS